MVEVNSVLEKGRLYDSELSEGNLISTPHIQLHSMLAQSVRGVPDVLFAFSHRIRIRIVRHYIRWIRYRIRISIKGEDIQFSAVKSALNV